MFYSTRLADHRKEERPPHIAGARQELPRRLRHRHTQGLRRRGRLLHLPQFHDGRVREEGRVRSHVPRQLPPRGGREGAIIVRREVPIVQGVDRHGRARGATGSASERTDERDHCGNHGGRRATCAAAAGSAAAAGGQQQSAAEPGRAIPPPLLHGEHPPGVAAGARVRVRGGAQGDERRRTEQSKSGRGTTELAGAILPKGRSGRGGRGKRQ